MYVCSLERCRRTALNVLMHGVGVAVVLVMVNEVGLVDDLLSGLSVGLVFLVIGLSVVVVV